MGLTINPEAKIASKGQEHISQNRGCYDLETKYIPKAPLLWACSPADSAILRGTRNYEVGLGLRNQITLGVYRLYYFLFTIHCGVYSLTCSHHDVLP